METERVLRIWSASSTPLVVSGSVEGSAGSKARVPSKTPEAIRVNRMIII